MNPPGTTDPIGVTLGLTTTVLSVVLYLWTALALSAVFRKSGEESWKGWVPIYNQVVLLRLGGFSGWFLLLLLFPIVGWIVLYAVQVIACHRVNLAFGLGPGMTVLAALLFPVWASVVGFGSARWLGHPEDIGGPSRTGNISVPVPAAAPAGSAVYGDWAVQPTAPASPAGAPAGWPHRSSADPSDDLLAPAAPAVPAPAASAPASSVVAEPAPAWTPAPVGGSAHALRSYQHELDDDLEVSAIAPGAVPPQSAATAARARRAGWEEPDEDVAYHAAPSPAAEASDASPPAPSLPGAAPDEDVAPPAVPSPIAEPVDASPPAPGIPAPAHAAPLVTRVPIVRQEPPVEPWAPRRSPQPDMPVDTTDEVSAVVGAPMAGSPRSALGAVSALSARPGIPDDEGFDETIIARRRRVEWELVPPIGKTIDLTSDVIIVGRRPSGDPAHPTAQLVPIADETRTVSKTHARLELRGDQWMITDLGSTNGVLLPTLMGTELEAQPGVEVAAGERFFLGDAEVRLRRSGA
ncbi:DUF5684 domain-containing protein [Microbacterium sp. CJ88]|uniref:DUF5684 domain-containing protein n=1 Tax=Microbacterium sp. CJ88 TaxID=3445672 RepID=UPI003F6607AA